MSRITDPLAVAAMFQRAIAFHLETFRGMGEDARIRARESFLDLPASVALSTLMGSSAPSHALARAVILERLYYLATSAVAETPPFECAWDHWRMPHAIANLAAEYEGVDPWEVAVYAGFRRVHTNMALPFRDPSIPLEPNETLSRPKWRLHIYCKKMPRTALAWRALNNSKELAYEALERERLVNARRATPRAGS